MSSYVLSDEEQLALSFGLERHVLVKCDNNLINTEFEHYFQNIKNTVPNINDEKMLQLKTKLFSTREKYNNVKVPFKHRQVIKRLVETKNIMLLRKDKGKGVVIMDKGKYTEKCINLLDSNQVSHDLSKSAESKVKRALRKIKTKLSQQNYVKLYPIGSALGKFYGTAKKQKMPENATIEDLPLHPIVSNIGTASYHLAKYLGKVLSPLSKSEYTVNSTTDFLKSIRNLKIPNNHKVISFHVKALFTNVPLDYTINVILRRIYDNHEIDTNISKKEMKDLLILCTKNVHFSFNGDIYIQCDGVAMGSSLGPTLAGIFVVELERSVVPKLSEHMMPWKRFVDDTITCIKATSIPHVIKALNNSNMQFTYEEQRNGKVSFLDVLLIKKNDAFEITVYRKPNNKSIIYIGIHLLLRHINLEL